MRRRLCYNKAISAEAAAARTETNAPTGILHKTEHISVFMKEWYKLDNAAKVFPPTSGTRNTSVFRIAAVLKEPVRPDLLQRALNRTLPRYPMLAVQLRKGVFWNYLEPNTRALPVQEETGSPMAKCKPKQENGYCLRVLYAGCRISVEIYHCLCDGNGGLEFIKTLLCLYYAELGETIDTEGKVLLPGDGIDPEESEDAFVKYAFPPERQKKKEPDAYRLQGIPFEEYGNNLVHGLTDAGRLNALAKSANCTVTSYLGALLLYCVYRQRIYPHEPKKTLSLAVPVNLRKAFPSRTLRNFFVVPNIRVPFHRDTDFIRAAKLFDEALRAAATQSNLESFIGHNIMLERNRFNRAVPLVIKNFFVEAGFHIWGENKKTMTLSNLGRAALPAALVRHVSHLEVCVYPTTKSPYNCGVISACGKTCITFSRTVVEADILQMFFSTLAQNGLEVEVYSNDWGGGVA